MLSGSCCCCSCTYCEELHSSGIQMDHTIYHVQSSDSVFSPSSGFLPAAASKMSIRLMVELFWFRTSYKQGKQYNSFPKYTTTRPRHTPIDGHVVLKKNPRDPVPFMVSCLSSRCTSSQRLTGSRFVHSYLSWARHYYRRGKRVGLVALGVTVSVRVRSLPPCLHHGREAPLRS